MNLKEEIDPNLWIAVRRSYEAGAWSNAIIDAVHFLSEAIRVRSNLQSDGTALAGQALGGKNPKLKLNRLETETEQNIQSGVEQLLRGIYQAVRNPISHGKTDDTQQDCDSLIIFIGYLLRVLGHAKPAFTVDGCVKRVLDESYVHDHRYSALLVDEIPSRYRFEVALAVFQSREQSNAENAKWFLEALLPKLSDEEQVEFFAAVSGLLREANDDASIRGALKCLPPSKWVQVNHIASLPHRKLYRSEYA